MEEKSSSTPIWHVWAPITISGLSFALSLYSWHYQTREHHEFKASVVEIHEDNPQKGYKGKALLLNTGNRAEALISARFIFGSLLGDTVGPIIVKPGEAAIIDLAGTSPALSDIFSDPNVVKNRSFTIGVIYVIADTRSGQKNKDMYLESRARFTTIHLDTEQKMAIGASPSPSDIGASFVDLYQGRRE
jgi:hypothetical protein